MNAIETVKEYLKKNKYDGLYNAEAGCACEIDDIAPCYNGFNCGCTVGYKTPCDPDTCEHNGMCDFHISASQKTD
jgi:hypothetical protein